MRKNIFYLKSSQNLTKRFKYTVIWRARLLRRRNNRDSDWNKFGHMSWRIYLLHDYYSQISKGGEKISPPCKQTNKSEIQITNYCLHQGMVTGKEAGKLKTDVPSKMVTIREAER